MGGEVGGLEGEGGRGWGWAETCLEKAKRKWEEKDKVVGTCRWRWSGWRAMRATETGLAYAPCHRRMVITTLFSVLRFGGVGGASRAKGDLEEKNEGVGVGGEEGGGGGQLRGFGRA